RVLCCLSATNSLFLVLGGAHGANALRKARDFARCGFAMDHAFLCSTNDDRLCFLQCCASGLLISGSDSLLHFAYRAPHAAPPRLVGGGTADGLASGFLCRFRVGHDVILGQRIALAERADSAEN